MSNIFSNINAFSHFLLKSVIKPGDHVVDATIGNGNDTLFLAQQVGKTGKVYGFDIQEKAISNTASLLSEHGLADIVTLIHDGHENLLKYIAQPIKAAVFNLGYLPKGDHTIITLPETTISALGQAAQQLSPKGVITVTVYPGHEGGKNEQKAVEDFVSTLEKKQWDVLSWSFLNRSTTAPYLIVIYKREVNKLEDKTS